MVAMRIGTWLGTVAVASSLVALGAYGVTTMSLRRDQLWRELTYEERSLAIVLRGALEAALEHRKPQEIREFVEQLSAADRVYGIAVHSRSGEVAMSDTVRDLSGHVSREALDRALAGGREEELRVAAGGSKYLVHVLPLQPAGGATVAVAEVWRDLGYIDEYLRNTAVRLLVLAAALGLMLAAGIVAVTRRAVTRPATALVQAMARVAGGDLSARVAGDGRTPGGELGDIARSFDRLAESLGQARGALEAATAERSQLASRLRQSERLATLGQIVAEVAHELGTPLNVVSGRAEDTLQLALEQGEARQVLAGAVANAAEIREQGRRITRILQRLLDLSRERMPELGDVRVLEVARRVGSFLAPDFWRQDVALAITGDERAVARADPDMVQQVLVNLVVNALQASPRRGAVRLRVEGRDGQVVVEVSDEGPGVPDEMVPRLFEPFATTKPRGQGTGLGLSISRSILRQLGGSLRYARGPVGGAVFQATLLAAGGGKPLPLGPAKEADS